MEEQQSGGKLEQHPAEAFHELLSTKLTPPRLHPHSVLRAALLARLDHGLDQKLTLISAPAGFGKTTLVSEWIAYRLERDDLPPTQWVSLDSGDNDPVRFWRYVLAACRPLDDGASTAALALLNNASWPAFQAILTLLINGLARLATKAVLVIEDYHAITNEPVHETLTFFLDHLPPSLHLILMTRSDPHLPLARLRARDELNELQAEDLRFTQEETRAFLEQALPFTPTPEVVTRLVGRTEGWAAGLRLVSLALQQQRDEGQVRQFLDTFAGSHRPVMDYFIEDVFNAQPAALQQFLLQTSVLSRLTGSLCDALAGRDDSARLLEQMERDNLFLVSLDAARQWFRFHTLFAEALQKEAQKRLGEDRLRALSLQASRWYEAHALLAEAVEAALLAQEWPRATSLIERVIAPQLVQNEYYTLRRWLERLPEHALRERPAIAMFYVAAILFTMERHTPFPGALIQELLHLAEAHWRAANDRPMLGETLAIRANVALQQGDFLGAFSAARQSLELLPEQAPWRGSSLIIAGMEELYAGRLDAARRWFTQAQTASETDRNFYATSIALLSLGEVYTRQGALRRSAQFYRQVLIEIERAPMYSEDLLRRRGLALAGLGKLALEWNDLDLAQQYGEQARDIAGQVEDEGLLVAGAILLARIRDLSGDHAPAQEELLELESQTTNPVLLREIQACHAWLAIRAGDLLTAQRWAGELPPAGRQHITIQEELEAMVMARLLIAQGEPGKACRLLEEWLPDAQAHGRMKSVLEGKVLLALAHSARSDPLRSRQALLEALALAEPEGYQRIFLDEGLALARLLQGALPHIVEQTLTGYAKALLYTYAHEQRRPAASDPGAVGPIIEPLSEQEQRVLRLLAAGRSNPDIAGELVISINTVKTHVKNIYGKLGINSREQARQAARHLKTY